MTAVSSGASSGPSAGSATKTALEVEQAPSDLRAPVVAIVSSRVPEEVRAVEIGAVDTSDIGRIKSALEKRRKMFLVTALEGARQAGIESNELCVEFAPADRHLRDTLAKPDNVKILREVCKEITGGDLGVRFVITDTTVAADAPVSKEEARRREKQDLRETAEKDPQVQKMLRTFRGEIIDVRRLDGES